MAKRGSSKKRYLITCISITLIIMVFSVFIDSVFPLPDTEDMMPSSIMLGNSGDDALYRDTEIPNGSITIIEFSDFQCPFCREAQSVLKRVKDNYGSKVQIIFRHFPSGHEFSSVAAEAAECAADQNMFWQYHDKLYSSQISSKQDLVDYAESMGMDKVEFSDCLLTHKKQEIVRKDYELGISMGIPGTPTFIIGEQNIIGIPKYSDIKEMIDAELEAMEDEKG